MTETKRTSILAWLLQHAELGELPDHIDAEGRIYAVKFLQAAISIQEKKEPAQLAEITTGSLEGEYHG